MVTFKRVLLLVLFYILLCSYDKPHYLYFLWYLVDKKLNSDEKKPSKRIVDKKHLLTFVRRIWIIHI